MPGIEAVFSLGFCINTAALFVYCAYYGLVLGTALCIAVASKQDQTITDIILTDRRDDIQAMIMTNGVWGLVQVQTPFDEYVRPLIEITHVVLVPVLLAQK